MGLFSTLLTHRRGVALVTLLLMISGVYLVTQLPITLYPNTRKVTIQVHIPHASFSGPEFSARYSESLQRAFADLDGVEQLEISYQNGTTRVKAEFAWGVPSSEAKAIVAGAMAPLQSVLPNESDRYSIHHWSGRSTGFFAAALYSDVWSADEVYEKARPLIQPRLDRLRHIDRAEIRSTREKSVKIVVDPLKSLSYGISPEVIATKIRQSYRDLSIGSFRQGRDLFTVRIAQGIRAPKDIEGIVLEVRNGHPVHVKDVADVRIDNSLAKRFYRIDGQVAVICFALPSPDGNVRKMSQAIQTILQDAKDQLPDHVRVRVLIDPADFINRAIINVVRASLIGGGLAILVVLLLLGDIRNTLLIGISIPCTITASFLLMKAFGVTLNLISLGGLALAVGMIIDSSIVVIENMSRHLGEKTAPSILSTIRLSVVEVRGAIIASTLTSLVVFVPLTFTAELTSAVLGDLAKTVIFALACSLFAALVVVPAAYFSLLTHFPQLKGGKGRQWAGSLRSTLVHRYRWILGHILKSRWPAPFVLAMSLIVLIFSLLWTTQHLDRKIIDKPDSRRITLRFSNTTAKSERDLLQAIHPIETKILEKFGDQIESLFVRSRGQTSGAFTLTVKTLNQREPMIGKLKAEFPSNRNWRFDISRWDPAELPLPRVDDLRVSFHGNDPLVIRDLMQRAIELIQDLALYSDVKAEPSMKTLEEVQLHPRRDIISNLGMSMEGLSQAGRVLLSEPRVIELTDDDEELDIHISYDDAFITNPTDLADHLIPYEQSAVPLKHLFDLRTKRTISEVMELDGQSTFYVLGELPPQSSNADRVEALEQVRKHLSDNLEVPAGYRYIFEDSQKEVANAIQSLALALAASVILVFVILGAQFNSFMTPLAMLLTIPLGITGVLWSLVAFGSSLSLNSMLGTILLVGISVNNAILIIDFFHKHRHQFATRVEALIHAAGLRLTPILITSLTTILGMLPIAIGWGEGTNVIQPLGIAISGGLGVATLMTLFVIPCVLKYLPDPKPTSID